MKITNKSKNLIQFFKDKNINYDRVTLKSAKLLKTLHSDLVKAFNVTPNDVIKFKRKQVSNPEMITKPKYFGKDSFPKAILYHIDNKIKSEITCSFNIYDRKINLFFMNEDNSDAFDYGNCVQYIIAWLKMINKYAITTECAKTLNIYIYMTSLEKELPSSNEYILDQNNVNTAFTSTCSTNSEIIIFRKEEWLKVLMHETFHTYNLDFSIMDNSSVNKYILNIFKVKSDVNAYEAYTEFWAEIMNVAFCSYVKCKNKKDFKEFLYYYEIFINLERSFSFFQLVKTLDFMGLSYDDLYSKTSKNKSNFKENSNILSYYVLKTILINDYQGFLDWCYTNNDLYLSSLQYFKKTHKNLSSFCNYIKSNYKTESMISNIHNATTILNNIKKSDRKKHLLLNMRMTICELC
jgi:hypothetical protein